MSVSRTKAVLVPWFLIQTSGLALADPGRADARVEGGSSVRYVVAMQSDSEVAMITPPSIDPDTGDVYSGSGSGGSKGSKVARATTTLLKGTDGRWWWQSTYKSYYLGSPRPVVASPRIQQLKAKQEQAAQLTLAKKPMGQATPFHQPAPPAPGFGPGSERIAALPPSTAFTGGGFVPVAPVAPPPGPSQPLPSLFEANLGIDYEPIFQPDGTFFVRLNRSPRPNSPAAAFGLEAGDLIIALDGQRFRTANDVSAHTRETTVDFVDVRTNHRSAGSLILP